MNIFYINIDEFKKNYNKDFLASFAQISCKSEKRLFEHSIGRFLVKSAGKLVYNISDTEIVKDKNNKPKFKNSDIFFNISHSKNIVIACFDEKPCSVDIEYIKNRNLERFSKFFGQKFDSLDDFYKFWTLKEAKYKLNDRMLDYKTVKFLDEYILTIASCSEIKYKIYNYLNYKKF